MDENKATENINYSKYKHKALLVAGLGTFLATLESSIVNVSLPTIARELTTSLTMVGWVVLSYSVTIISLLMVFGAVSEKKGFQFSYKCGFIIFGAGSILCGVSYDIIMLIVSRIIQGVGAAMMISVGAALITRSFPENERGRGLAVISMVVSSGLMLGPSLGGFIISLFGWRWIFLVNVPVAIFGLVFTIKYFGGFPISNPDRKVSFRGAFSLSLSLLSMILGLLLWSRGVIGGWQIIVIAAISVMAAGLFLYFEVNPRTRLIGLDILKNRIFTVSGIAMLLVFVTISSVSVLMPFYLEMVKGLTPDRVGLFLMIVPASTLIIAPLAGYLSDKLEPRYITSFGTLVIAFGIYRIRFISAEASISEIALVLILIGLGMGIFSTPNNSSMMGAVEKKQLGSASGILATIRTLGITFGVGSAIVIFAYYQNRMTEVSSDSTASFIYGYRSVYDFILFIIVAAAFISFWRGNNRGGKIQTISE